MLFDIYAHTQRRLSLNFYSQLLTRQLSSLTSSQLYTRQLSSLHVKSVLCTSSQLSAPGGLSRPGQASAWAAPVSVCQRLANACQHLSAPGPRLGHTWAAHGSTVPRDPDNYPPPGSEAVRGFKPGQCT